MPWLMTFAAPHRHSFDPPFDCDRCDRLVTFRDEARQQCPGGFNGAVPSFGDPDAWLLIIGLAPGMQGANRTGRPFTGDYAGDLLYETLLTAGLAEGNYDRRSDDGLQLKGAMITNAVRCVPPQNKPATDEAKACQDYLMQCLNTLATVKVLLCLGKIAHDATLRTLGSRLSAAPFGHAAVHEIGPYTLVDSYHCSRYNTNTGRLTAKMFAQVFEVAKQIRSPELDSGPLSI
ncbi:MAG: uracil-DNA glycosylase [Pseudomonadota bacterium]